LAKRYSLDELAEIDLNFKELVELKPQYYILVDKQMATRKAIFNTLSAVGIEKENIIECSDAYEATSKINVDQNQYIVLTELNLPDINGFKFMERVAKKKADANVKFVIITADASKQNFAMSIKMGAAGFIKKPFNNDELKESLVKFGLLDIEED
jgi:two-component system chemotaxis response regulator CheY